MLYHAKVKLIRRICVCAVVLSVLLSLQVTAGIVRIDYSGTAIYGPFAGQVYNGFFTYDMSIVVPNSKLSWTSGPPRIGFEQSAGFSLGSLAFDESTSSVTFIKWDEAGEVTGFEHHNDNFLDIGTDAFAALEWGLLYTSMLDTSLLSAQIVPVLITQSTDENPVPEPSTILLSVVGLVGISYLRRRNKSVCVN